MPFASTRRRGARLKARFAVKGIHSSSRDRLATSMSRADWGVVTVDMRLWARAWGDGGNGRVQSLKARRNATKTAMPEQSRAEPNDNDPTPMASMAEVKA